jgi:hypothetical protein
MKKTKNPCDIVVSRKTGGSKGYVFREDGDIIVIYKKKGWITCVVLTIKILQGTVFNIFRV